MKMISAASWALEAPGLWRKQLGDRGPRLVDDGAGPAWVLADRRRPLSGLSRSVAEGGASTVEAHLEWLATADGRRWLQRRDGLDAEVLYGLSPAWELIRASGDAGLERECCTAWNEWLAGLCAADPQRFVGVARIPATGLDDAVAELQRASGLGLRGALLDDWPCAAQYEGLPAAASGLFWETAERLGVPVSLHRGFAGEAPEEDGPVKAGYAPTLWTHLASIIYANVCDDFPRLRIVVADPTPGWAPAIFESINEDYMRSITTRKVRLGDPDLLPADYLRRYFWYTVQQDRFTVLNRGYWGTAHLMWASFTGSPDSVWPNNAQEFARVSAGLPADDRQALAAHVVSRLYRLDGAPEFSADEITRYERYALL